MQPNISSTSSDVELLCFLKEDNSDAFEEIYNKYWPKLYLSAYNLLRDRYAAEDIVQEVLVQLWMKRQSQTIESLNSYLYAAVRFQVFNLIRSGKVREHFFNRIEELSIENTAEDHLYAQDVLKKIDEGLAELPDRCREIFTLSRKDQLSTKEIAARLGIAPKTVENQLTIAIRRLRSTMEHMLFWLLFTVWGMWF
uniref:RNA polymerase sigma factor n=1 Tax=Pedobacter schmidteae TaxID=2201271 RepID=UPI000EAEA49B|nr:RNA polymerase sigma-70 factor [Pedobacter schmidteae]